MFAMKSAWTRNQNPAAAIKELAASIQQPAIRLVMFFAAYGFNFEAVAAELHKAFPGATTVGVTTSGEIAPGVGYTDGVISAASFSADEFVVEPVLIENVKKNALLVRGKITEAAGRLGLNHANGFGVMFFDWVPAVEDRLMLIVRSALPEVPLIGGTSGDNRQFKYPGKIALNGQTYTNAALLTLVRTNAKVFAYKENIFVPTEVELSIDAADVNTRTVNRINGAPAAKAYARVVGVNESDLNLTLFMKHPLGRLLGNSVYTATPSNVTPDGGIHFFTAMMPGTKVRMLKAVNTVEAARQTAEAIRRNLPNCKGIIGISCICRKLQFEVEQSERAVYDAIASVAPMVGFSSYGEQFKHHVNQTLVLLAFGD
ncbi:MAG TPA: FIST N-terminal domain-containing protein [Symbiobacteriaceae bacterium]|jgi:hypothetical protein